VGALLRLFLTDIRWITVIRFTPRLLYWRWNSSRYPIHGRLTDFQNFSGPFGEEKILFALYENGPQFLNLSFHSLVSVLTLSEEKTDKSKNWSHNIEFFVLAKNMKHTCLLLASLFLAVFICPMKHTYVCYLHRSSLQFASVLWNTLISVTCIARAVCICPMKHTCLLLASLFLTVCICPNLSVHVNQDAEWGGTGFNGSLTMLKGPVLMKSLSHTLPLLSQSKYIGS
jgi:hypothetical protein